MNNMGQLGPTRKWPPLTWIGLAALILVVDFLSGPLISFSIFFVIPVALASRFNGRRWGIVLGALMPIAHFGFMLFWSAPWTLGDAMINAAIRIVVLVGFAVLIDRVTHQAREIRVLRGLLPVCSFCKKIRTEEEKWQPIEFYITERSEASFTHTFCPECARQHYGEYYDQIKARQDRAANTTPK